MHPMKEMPVRTKYAPLVYPKFATSFWSFKFALHYLGRSIYSSL